MNALYELLLFPKRAEFLGQFSAYDVDLDHWKSLSAVFRKSFREVYEQRSSALLLVHGGQGTGKTLFSRRLEQDFVRSKQNGALGPDSENLWHTLVGDDPPTRATIEKATLGSDLRRVEPASGWLERHRTFARENRSRVRVFIFDDAHKDVFMCEWAGLSRAEYLGFKERKTESVVLESVAQKLVEDCRGDFQSSIFLLLSNDAAQMQTLKEQVERSHRGLARVLELPLPAPEVKEKIVRTNTNRLNRMSYWSCLDGAGKDERASVFDALMAGDKGFTESFEAVDNALQSGGEAKRRGRPANRNLITLVTLGTTPSVVKSFIDDSELAVEEHFRGEHLGVWFMRESWASSLYTDTGSDTELFRRVRLVESEFALRWVALDMKATSLLCERTSGLLKIIAEKELLEIIRFTPSIAKPDDVQRHGSSCENIDDRIRADQSVDVAVFAQRFVAMGQQRSREYEAVLAERLTRYGRGFAVFPALKPDFIVDEYRPCAVTQAKDREPAAITEAIKRTCHAIEFTAYVQSDMRGLKKYLLEKVERYAELLETV
jgi:hypothetical protein